MIRKMLEWRLEILALALGVIVGGLVLLWLSKVQSPDPTAVAVRRTIETLHSRSGLTCAKCGAAMEKGFVGDGNYRYTEISSWQSGLPEEISEYAIKTGTKLPIATLRCKGCGYLESYAK